MALEQKALGGAARGIAFRLVENFGAMSRSQFGEELKQLGQDERAKLRNLGVRFGEYTLFMPKLLKPQPAKLLTLLWALWTDREPGAVTPPKAGLVSFATDANIPPAYYYASGYRPSGSRAVRIDMLERLAGQIRSERRDGEYQGGFEASQQLMSLVGCSGEDFESILTSLGYRKQTIKVKRPAAAPAVSADASEPSAPAEVATGGEAPASETALEFSLPPETEAEADRPAAEVEAAQPAPEALAAPEPDSVSPTANEPPAAAPSDVIDVVIWKMAPRRQPNRKPREPRDQQSDQRAPRERRDAKGDGAPRQDRRNADRSSQRPPRSDGERGPPPRRDRERDRGPRHEGPRAPRHYHSLCWPAVHQNVWTPESTRSEIYESKRADL